MKGMGLNLSEDKTDFLKRCGVHDYHSCHALNPSRVHPRNSRSGVLVIRSFMSSVGFAIDGQMQPNRPSISSFSSLAGIADHSE
jgi:hypothetical protein